jgi:hypothetical protein
MKTYTKIIFIVMIVFGLIAAVNTSPAFAEPHSIRGKVTQYNGDPFVGVEVHCTIYPMYFNPNYGFCEYATEIFDITTAITDSRGRYICSHNFTRDPDCGDVPPYAYASIPSFYNLSEYEAVDGSPPMPSDTVSYIDIINLPDLHSPSKQIYARRISPMTPYPIAHIEGFDPPDAIKSGPDISGAKIGMNYMDMMGATELPGGLNALSHVFLNNYTFWLVMNGRRSGDSYRGTTTNHYTDGLIYQTMTVVKQIADEHKAQFGNQFQGLIVGGFSGGGLAARTGLLYWCNGYWFDAGNYGSPGVNNIDLPTGCHDVAGWYAGDSPLEGCMMPSALQKFAYDLEFADGNKQLLEMRDVMFENDYSAEILRYTVPWWEYPHYDGPFDYNPNYNCNTGCTLEDDYVCNSTSWDSRCPFNTSRHDEFINWAYGGAVSPNQYVPLRNDGSPIPGIAWSHGAFDPTHPKGGLRSTAEHDTWLHIRINMLSIMVHDRDIYLHNNIGGDLDENVNGSFFSQFVQMRNRTGNKGSNNYDIPLGWVYIALFPVSEFFNWLPIEARYEQLTYIYPEDLPTYMPTTSALATNTIGLENWNDYYWQDQNCAHIPSTPKLNDAGGEKVSINVVDPDPELPDDEKNGGFGQNEIEMLFGFVHEHLKGKGSVSPICTGVKDVGKKAECRVPETEICNCQDDDGDECVDGTMTANGCDPLPNCSPHDFKVCPGVNNTCAPSCYNRECGTDGCGGFCGTEDGTCGKGQECMEGQCVGKTYSCAADPAVVNTCSNSCNQSNNCAYSANCVPGECDENCILDLCPGGGDDDGDTIWGAGIWDFDARSATGETDDYYSNSSDYFDPSEPCYATTGSRDVGFIWRPDELRHRDVNIAIWPATQNNVLIIREGDCSGNEILCTFKGAWGYWEDTQLNDFYAAAEQYCIIVDGRGLDDGYGWYGGIGQLRIWDAATDEICNNGSDDDGSGSIDCDDWKCYDDEECYAPEPCGTNCFPHLWITTRDYEGHIWYYDGDNWRETNSYDPTCGPAGGKDGVMPWYTTKTGYWTFDTYGSNYDTVLWVMDAGTFGSTNEIACNNDAGGGQQSEVTIYAVKDEVFMIGVDTNGTFDITGTDVEIHATFTPAAGGGCYGGGYWEFCQIACPCLEGQGDCDSDLECADGLICHHPDSDAAGDYCVDDPASSYSGGNIAGQKFYRTPRRNDIYNVNQFDSSRLVAYDNLSLLPAPKQFSEQSIILSATICQSSQCEGDFCNVECPCAEGEGDCDSDAECGSGLECGQDNGPEWGCGIYTDICIDPANPDGPFQAAGGGCTGDLICGVDFCQPECPCIEGQADCDSDSECLGDLICTHDVGDDFGCATDRDVCTINPAISGGGCVNAARCDNDFCDPSCPCNQGHGNCSTDDDCVSGLVCAINVGENWNCPADTNICVVPSTNGGGCNGDSQCDPGFCSVECPCLEGEGNCDHDSDCAADLRCEFNVGDSYGCDASVNICVAGLRHCDPDYCSTSSPCGPGQGDCDSNAECKSGLVCVQDVGADYGCADSTIDICDLDPSVPNGGCQGGSQCDSGFCDSACPCVEGQGQCDSDDDCAYILTCQLDEGNSAGCGSSAYVCKFPDCVPECGSRVCGPDPVCGESCGTCSGDQVCNNGVCEDPSSVYRCPCDQGLCDYCWCDDPDRRGNCDAGWEGDNSCDCGCQFSDDADCGTCTPNCTGKNCGDDGCGGSCGTCSGGQVCNNGTCEDPPTGDCISISGGGTHTGDSSSETDDVDASCNGNNGTPDICYYWTANDSGTHVIDTCGANSFDTVLSIHSQDGSTELACSDDDGSCSYDKKSTLSFNATAGTTYMIVIDGYYSDDHGSYTLNIDAPAGCTPDCTGKNCGDDGCGGSCGSCSGGQVCNSGTCEDPSNVYRCPCDGSCAYCWCDDPVREGNCETYWEGDGECDCGCQFSDDADCGACTPNCSGKNCGDDGCGGSCGTCSGGQVCNSGVCEDPPTGGCDNDNTCDTGEDCGSCPGDCGACGSGGCDGSHCDYSFCSSSCPGTYGQADCDSNAECVSGLVCGWEAAQDFGCDPVDELDACVPIGEATGGYCGDQICDSGGDEDENSSSCPADCP